MPRGRGLRNPDGALGEPEALPQRLELRIRRDDGIERGVEPDDLELAARLVDGAARRRLRAGGATQQHEEHHDTHGRHSSRRGNAYGGWSGDASSTAALARPCPARRARAVRRHQPGDPLVAHRPSLRRLLEPVLEAALRIAAGARADLVCRTTCACRSGATASPTSCRGRRPASTRSNPQEYVEGRIRLRRKILRYRPRMVALIGVTVFRALFPAHRGP